MIDLPFYSNGLLLRNFENYDIPSIVQIASTPGFSFYALAPHTSSQNEIKRSAESFVLHAKEFEKPHPQTGIREKYKLAVAFQNAPDTLVGYVAFDEISECNGEKRDIGYLTAPLHQGKGIAGIATFLVLDQFYQHTAYDKVWATVHPNNTPSHKLLSRLGFKEVGVTTKIMHGITEPRLVLSLARCDFQPQRSMQLKNHIPTHGKEFV